MLIHIFTAVLLGSTPSSHSASDTNRKRKSDWMNQHVDFGQSAENGPTAKVSSKDRDRRKSQGEFERAFSTGFVESFH